MVSMILFVLPFLAGLIGAHYLLFITSVKFLGINSLGIKYILLAVPLLLTLSMIPSALLLRTYRNFFTEGYSVFVMVWIGLFINLLMVSFLIWIVYMILLLVGHTSDMKMICLIGFALAALVTVLGTWNSRAPKVTNVEVQLKNLPEIWKGKTIVQLSDVHFGAIRGISYFNTVVEMTNAQNPDLILITGDLFDGMGGNYEHLVEPLNALRATKGVYFVMGNHEGYLGLTEPLAVLAETDLRVLDNEVVDIDGLQIVGIPFPEHDRPADSEKALALGEKIDPDKPSILMYHTPTDVLLSTQDRAKQQNRTYLSPDVQFNFAKTNKIDLQLSGHTHEGQFFPFTLVSHRIFKGFDYGLHKVGDFQVYTTSGTGTWGPPLRLASRSEIAVIHLK